MSKENKIGLSIVVGVAIFAAFIMMYITGIIGSYHSYIEQQVRCESVMPPSYFVSTYLWVYKGGNSINIEKSWHKRCQCADIPEVKEMQMYKAMEYKVRVDEKLKTFKECELK